MSRNKKFSVNMSEVEYDLLQAIAEENGRGIAGQAYTFLIKDIYAYEFEPTEEEIIAAILTPSKLPPVKSRDMDGVDPGQVASGPISLGSEVSDIEAERKPPASAEG